MLIETLAVLALSAPMAMCDRGSDILNRIFVEFEAGQIAIDAEDGEILDRIAAQAATEPRLYFGVHGFADHGEAEQRADWRPEDLQLAERRSQAVADWLAGKGVASGQMGQQAHGLRGRGGDQRTDAAGRDRYTAAVVVLSLRAPPWTGPGPRPVC